MADQKRGTAKKQNNKDKIFYFLGVLDNELQENGVCDIQEKPDVFIGYLEQNGYRFDHETETYIQYVDQANLKKHGILFVARIIKVKI